MRTSTRTFLSGALVVMVIAGAAVSAQRGGEGRSASRVLSGTFELEATRGDNAQRAAEDATRAVLPNQRDRVYQTLLARLQPPATLAIDRNGSVITISSSSGPRTTFDADGHTRSEMGPEGRQMTTRAEFRGDTLSVSTVGNRSLDFQVTFESIDRGAGLLVTRRLDSDDIRQPVTIRSYYHRVSEEPRWDVYAPHNDGPGRSPRAFTLKSGIRIEATLDSALSTRTARSGERFVMTVDSPDAYRGARITGIVARMTSYDQGRNADMQIDFDTMQLPNGQIAQFDAELSTVRTPGGVTLRVDAAGRGPESRRDDSTVANTAIGAGLGAIIGAIAGGGKGAAIGAVLGGAGGAIVAQDRDQYIDLPPGTVVTMIVTAPRDHAPQADKR